MLVTSMNRRRFDEQGRIVPTLGDYPEAMRQVAEEAQVALIDLNIMSKDLFETLGPDISEKHSFITRPTVSRAKQGSSGTIPTYKVPQLAEILLDDVQAFDPRHPDSIGAFRLRASPAKASEKPVGN